MFIDYAFSILFSAFYFIRTLFLTGLNKILPSFFPSFGYNLPAPTNAVLITGASSGIGKDAALHLAKQGYMVFAGVRRTFDGTELVKSFEKTQKKGFLYPVILDVSNELSVKEARRTVEEKLRTVDARLVAVVNNAGMSKEGLIEFEPIARVKQVMDVNFFGAYLVTQNFLSLLRQGGSGGRFVNISSIAVLETLPMMGGYTASKCALEGFSGVLRKELYNQGIAVSIIEPGPIRTSIFEKAQAHFAQASSDRSLEQRELIEDLYPLMAEPETVVGLLKLTSVSSFWTSTIIQHSIENPFPKTHYFVNPETYFFSVVQSILPVAMYDKLLIGKLQLAVGLVSRFPRLLGPKKVK